MTSTSVRVEWVKGDGGPFALEFVAYSDTEMYAYRELVLALRALGRTANLKTRDDSWQEVVL